MSYKVDLAEKKDPTNQLEASKSNIKDLFNDRLDKAKAFKYQIIQKVELKKHKSTEIWIFSSLFQFSNKNSDQFKI